MKRFALLYSLYTIIAFILISYQPLVELLKIDYYYTETVTQISAALINFIGVEAYADGVFIKMHGAILEIKFGCNGLESLILFFTATLAYQATVKQKLYGLLLGFIVIELLNIVRIAFLGWVLKYHMPLFDVMHTYITQNIMIVIAFIAFIYYLQKVTPVHEN